MWTLTHGQVAGRLAVCECAFLTLRAHGESTEHSCCCVSGMCIPVPCAHTCPYVPAALYCQRRWQHTGTKDQLQGQAR